MPTKYEAQLKHARWYVKIVLDYSELIKNWKGETITEENYRRENGQINVARQWLTQQEIDNHIGELFLDYIGADVYAPYVQSFGDASTQMFMLEKGVLAARRLKHKDAEQKLLGALGRSSAELRKIQSAIDFYNMAILICQELGDVSDEAYHWYNMSLLHMNTRQIEAEITSRKRLIELLNIMGEEKSAAYHSWRIGSLYENQGNLVMAAVYMGRYIDFLREKEEISFEKHIAHFDQLRQHLYETTAQE